MITKEIRLHGDIERLYRPETTKLFFSLYKRGVSKQDISYRCGVVEDALAKAFPTVDFAKRGKIIFFKNKHKLSDDNEE